MRSIVSTNRFIPPILLVILSVMLTLVGCAPASTTSPTSSTSKVVIDWVDFIHIGGILYLNSPEKSGRSLTKSDLGPVFATVTFKLAGNVQTQNYRSKDGDAAFLDAGTKLYAVKGYKPTFRLAAQVNNAITLYEADTNPHARKGSDLLDIGGKVRSIGIVSDQDGVTELAAIKDPKQVATLVNFVMQAPIGQSLMLGKLRYFIVFHLADGTVVTRAYWLDTGELQRGILLSKAFGDAIKAALPASH
ncbi:MAG TPA: hypothetical protein VFN23_13950 [Ktedonobacteraceae bacterium]|nr:hypothetical protein [Ktedonobacteraceae bacterium]